MRWLMRWWRTRTGRCRWCRKPVSSGNPRYPYCSDVCEAELFEASIW